MGLKKWFDEKWVDIGSPKKGGGYKQCGRSKLKSDKKRKYPKCVPQAKANRMSESQKKSAVKRKRAKAQGVDGKPTNVKTFRGGGSNKYGLTIRPKLELRKQQIGNTTYEYKKTGVEFGKQNKYLPNLKLEFSKESDGITSPRNRNQSSRKNVEGSLEGRHGGVRGSYSKDAKGNTEKKIKAELKFKLNKGGLMKTYYKGML